ncbi:Alkaline phosphatase synthesis sensor protein PhoR [compost metagenome]
MGVPGGFLKALHTLYLPYLHTCLTAIPRASQPFHGERIARVTNSQPFARRFFPALRDFGLLPSLLSAALIGYALVMLLVAIPWIDRPFPGFTILHGQKIDYQLPESWSGAKAGLRPMDRILSVSGQPIPHSQALYSHVLDLPVGTPLTYQVARTHWDGRTEVFTRTVETQRFSLLNWGTIFLGNFLAALAFIVIGIVVAILKPGDNLTRAHLALCLSGAFHFLTLFDSTATTVWPNHVPSLLGLAVFGACGLNLGMQFPRPVNVSHGHRQLFLAVSALAVAAYGILAYPLEAQAQWSYLLPCAFAGMGGMSLFINSAWTLTTPKSSAREKAQARTLAWGAFLAVLPALGLFIAILAGNNGLLINLGALSCAMLPISIGIAIVRHGLFDIDLYLRPTLTYALISFLLVTLYFSALTVIGALIGTRSPLTNLVATAFVTLAFAPLRDRTKAWLDRTFFRSAYDPDAVRAEFTRLTQETLSSSELDDAFLQLLDRTFHLRYGAAFEKLDRPPHWHLLGSFGDLPRDASSLLLPADLPDAATFEIRVQGDLARVLKLGPKRSGLPYTKGDRRLIGELGHALAVRLNVYAYMRMEERQARQIEALEESQAMQTQFLNLVSHELKTPISVVLGSVGNLQLHGRTQGDPVLETYLGRIKRNAEQLSILLSDLLNAGQLQAGQFALHPRATSFGTIVDEAIADLASLAVQKQQVLLCAIPDALPELEGDPQRLGQVVRNLLVNAIKHTGKGTTIRITAEASSGRLRCEVIDEGDGIAPEDLPKLFQRFTRLSRSGERGAGLGLFIAKAIVTAHDGEIGVRSESGKGTTFWFTLPLKTASKQQAVSNV